MGFDSLQHLRVQETARRMDITLARGDRRNSLDFETWDELDLVMREVADRDEVRVVTLTGEGPAFCAGVDFKAIGDSLAIERKRYPSFIRRWAGVADRFERVAQTTIAAINGPAIGAGLEIALACDLRIASEHATFCLPQMQMGIVPDAGGTSRLARAVGSALAKDMVLSCRVVGAEEALRAGIVSRVVAHDRLAGEVDELAEQVASLPWPAAYFASLAIDVGPHLDPRRAADIEGVADQVMLRHEEVQGRVDSFMATKGLKGIEGSRA
ncbi:MAG TPA: enoyl-CoA hydratase/isomerase family protein [Acidimicrobiales bacterium]|nr:enoyl-CoA hydratase/isomerase family protein [Acidimicrobiales bacterium]